MSKHTPGPWRVVVFPNLRYRHSHAPGLGARTADSNWPSASVIEDYLPGTRRLTNILETKGWRPTCDHDRDQKPMPCVVLDPFVGSGTTVRVAKKFNRVGIGCDLAYQDIASLWTRNVQRRMAGMFG